MSDSNAIYKMKRYLQTQFFIMMQGRIIILGRVYKILK